MPPTTAVIMGSRSSWLTIRRDILQRRSRVAPCVSVSPGKQAERCPAGSSMTTTWSSWGWWSATCAPRATASSSSSEKRVRRSGPLPKSSPRRCPSACPSAAGRRQSAIRAVRTAPRAGTRGFGPRRATRPVPTHLGRSPSDPRLAIPATTRRTRRAAKHRRSPERDRVVEYALVLRAHIAG